jgi:hypothetical protein
MGLFDRKRKNAVQINDVSHQPIPFVWGWDALNPKRKGFKPFGNMYLTMVLETLYSGISNVTFETQGKSRDNYVAKGICSFIDSNATLLVNTMLNFGYVAVHYTKDYNYTILTQNDVKKDQFGSVINRDTVVVYSPIYQTKRQSLMMIVKPELELIDTLANNLVSSCGTMGVLPIISGNSIPANPTFKEQLAEAMSKQYGFGEDQLKYFLSQQELKVDKIDLQIKDLEFRDNLESAFKVLLNFFGVPVDLVIGNSTFNNVSESRRFFYETTIRNHAEYLLKIARALLTASPQFIPQSTINYRITNVQGIDKTVSDMCEERGAYVDLLIKLREAGVDVESELQRVYADIQNDYKIV